VQAVNDAAGRIARSLETGQKADAETLEALQTLANGIRETQDAAEKAWLEYRARFEAVDRSLEQTAVRLGETLGDSFNEFRRFAQDTDRELGSAVSKLAGTVTAIEEYAETLDAYVESARQPAFEAAE
jgi:ABC-type transporter Mla subunit MlaD